MGVVHPLADGILFSSWRDIPDEWWRWPDFEPWEFACRHCGETYWHPRSFNAAQTVRTRMGAPVRVNSGHRCWLKNLATPGASPGSMHLYLAMDLSTVGHDPLRMEREMRAAGYTGIGYYQTFLHGDLGRARFWFGGQSAKAHWKALRIASADIALA